MTNKHKKLLRAYWRATFAQVRIRQDGTVEAKRNRYGDYWGVLETAEQAKRSAEVLEATHGARRG